MDYAFAGTRGEGVAQTVSLAGALLVLEVHFLEPSASSVKVVLSIGQLIGTRKVAWKVTGIDCVSDAS
jgi:hypothetical protein